MPEAAELTSLKSIGPGRRLTHADIALALRLDADGKTQTFIAQQLDCNQSSVSDVLRKFSDSADLAKRKAHNLALKAVRKLDQAMDAAVAKGTSGPMDSILKIAGVLGDESQGPRVIVQIGMQDSDVQINLGSLGELPREP